jgi:hypothetical protein
VETRHTPPGVRMRAISSPARRGSARCSKVSAMRTRSTLPEASGMRDGFPKRCRSGIDAACRKATSSWSM